MGREVPRLWPLVGRDALLADLAESISTTAGFVVVGPAGVGKSRVLSALSETIDGPTTQILPISGAQATAAIPLAPLLKLVDLDRPGPLLTRVLAELSRRSQSADLVIAVDDAYLLDEASASLLHQVAVSGLAKLALTGRAGVTPPAAITALWKDGILSRVDIGPLDRRQTTRLVQHTLGPTSRAAARWFWQRSQGYPLFARELIRAAQSAGALREVDGVVELSKAIEISEPLRELIGQTIDGLDEETTGGLVALTLAKTLDLTTARSLIGNTVLEQLVQSGLARNDGARLEVAHPLYGELALARAPATQLQRQRIDVGYSLQKAGGREAEAMLLLIEANTSVEVALAEYATAQAVRMRQSELAIRLANELVKLQRDGPATAQLAAAHALNGELDAADEYYRDAVSRARGVEESAAVWFSWISSTFEYREDIAAARDLAASASSQLTGGAGDVAKAWHLRTRMFSEPLGPVLEGLTEQVQRPRLDEEAARMVTLDLAACSWHANQPHRGIAALAAGAALTQPDVVYRSRAMQVHNALLVWTKGPTAAEPLLQELVDFALESKDPDVALHAQAARMLFHARAGQAAATVKRDPPLDSLVLGASVNRWVSLFLSELAWAQCQLVNSKDSAAQTLKLADSAGESVAAPLIGIVHSRLTDDAAIRLQRLRSAVAVAQKFQLYTYELLAQRELLHHEGPISSVVDRIAELAERAGPGLATIFAREAEAMAEDNAVLMVAAAADAHDLGAIGMAWELYASAQILYSQQEQFRDAYRCELAVRKLGSQLPNQVSPIVDQLQAVLTAREQEVVGEVCAGRTNQEIAQRLFLSPKTVKRHLERIYGRLEVKNRQELADLAPATPPR